MLELNKTTASKSEKARENHTVWRRQFPARFRGLDYIKI